jgi:hypothetical protein
MTVSQIVNQIKRLNPEWTEMQILDLLNQFVEMVIQTDSLDAVYFDPSTGDLPYLSTTEGVFQYSLPSTFFKARNIVVNLASNKANNPYFYHNPTNEFVVPTTKIYLGSSEYVPVPCVIQPAFGDNVATVLFRFDPMDSTETYQIYGYNNAYSPITSMSATLPIEAKFHLSVVIPCLQMLIDGLDNGNFVDVVPKVMTLAEKIMIQKYYNANDDVSVEPIDL